MHLVAWCGILADNGPSHPGGWLTFLTYPVFILWLHTIITKMITSSRASTTNESRI